MISDIAGSLQSTMEITRTKFAIGQLIRHKRFDYRGVVVDVDPVFMGSEEWYQEVAKSRPPRNKPWYRVLVHDAPDETYVAERNLEADNDDTPINHPLIDAFFQSFDHSKGKYFLNMRSN